MDRRHFVKAIFATAAIASAEPGFAMTDEYHSDTLSIRLIDQGSQAASNGAIGKTLNVYDGSPSTALLLTEHGSADYVVVEAFYWTTINGQRALLHKETTSPLMKGATMMTEVPLALADIVFLRVREMNVVNQSEFGDVPKK